MCLTTDRAKASWTGVLLLAAASVCLFCSRSAGKKRRANKEGRAVRLEAGFETEAVLDPGKDLADDPVFTLAFSLDGGKLAAGSRAGFVLVWDLATRELYGPSAAHRGAVVAVGFDERGRRVISAGLDKALTVRGSDLKEPGRSSMLPHGMVTSAAIATNGRRVLSGGYDRPIHLIDVEKGKTVVSLPGHQGGTSRIAFSGDGKRAVSGSGNGAVGIWDLSSGRHLSRPVGHTRNDEIEELKRQGACRSMQQHLQYISAVALSRTGALALSGGRDSTVRLWSAETGKQLLLLEGHKKTVSSVLFLQEDRMGMSASKDGTLIFWNLEKGGILRRMDLSRGPLTAAAVDPVGRRIALGTAGGRVIVLRKGAGRKDRPDG